MVTFKGNIGLRFDITGNSTNVAGAVTQVYSLNTSVSDMTLSTSDIAYVYYGQVGANSYQLDLNNIDNISGSGTGIDMKVIRNQDGDLNNLKYMVVYNSDTSKQLTLTPGATTSLFTASEQVTLMPGQGIGLAYGNAETVGATTASIAITGSAESTNHYVYIYGN